jgi:hypothetical protein
MKIQFDRVIVVLIAICLAISGCTDRPKTTPTSTVVIVPTVTPTVVVPTLTFTATSIPFPNLSLEPGEYYFSMDGKPGFIFLRNIAGYKLDHYNTFLDWTKTGGSKIARIQLDSLGMGYTNSGSVDENWAVQWDWVFDQAEADGIYILPVFSGWFDWNAGSGYSTWKSNPLNIANDGPVKSPAELFQKDSATQTLWLQWMQTLVERWQGRRNILAWEVFSEVNLASGSTETTGIDFVNTAGALIRSTDPGRLVTASIADCPPGSGACYWPNFYRQANIDFIEMHPYPPSAQLDRTIISEARRSLAKYGRPILIGEAGLSAATPDSSDGKATVAENAQRGIRHAIWATIVSGAMNGRALYWEDSFGIYFPNLGTSWMQEYKTEELPAANFTKGVDFAGFQPLTSTSSSGVWGAAVGNENMVIGWYRDASCEPPNWDLQEKLSKQTVTVTVPGTAISWKIDFYNTKTGTDIVSSTTITRTRGKVTITLPDFTNDIAFKMYIKK